MKLEVKRLKTDILIIGGGTAGCFAGITAAENSDAKVIIAEKANIKRSGCLAAGVNAINAYINEGQTTEDYVNYVDNEFEHIVRKDLVSSIAERLNKVTEKVEKMGLPILKNKEGKYISRGKRSIKINGENIKPMLAQNVASKDNITVIERINITDYIVKDGKVVGAYGFSIDNNIFYVINAKAVICAAGGAAGLYRPNNPGQSQHKMWYSPFNVGSGYAMGIRAGAEMTSFEMRFIALRIKDTIAPTGTIAQGIKAKQINAFGEEYVEKYGKGTTIQRLSSTVNENLCGRGPCYLRTSGIDNETLKDLYKAYLNMAPAQTLKWIESGKVPSSFNVEIEGTEPYIVGGHSGSGYWIDEDRASTLEGLFAAGDVAGGSPKKYVTGCFAEGEIAALSAIKYIKDKPYEDISEDDIEIKLKEIYSHLIAKTDSRAGSKAASSNTESTITNAASDNYANVSYAANVSHAADTNTAECGSSADQIEEAMQKVMDEYAGGISSHYIVSMKKLETAQERIDELYLISQKLRVSDMTELLYIYELIDRLVVCKVLILHLMSRKETRWLCYDQNADYPERDDKNFLKFVNSRLKNGKLEIIMRDRGHIYEHKN